MHKKSASAVLPGTTPAEKLASLGIAAGKKVDIRILGRIANAHGIEVTLFFEKDLACNRTLESMREEFGQFPEYERPYVDVNAFLRFTRENDPTFEATLEAFPLMITIVSVSERDGGHGKDPVLQISGIMPFLDEFDVNAPAPEPNL